MDDVDVTKPPRRAVTQKVVLEIEKYLREKKYSVDQLAFILDVSPAVVDAIAGDKLRAIGSGPTDLLPSSSWRESVLRHPIVLSGEIWLTHPIRCNSCGSRIVVLPCRACECRRRRRKFCFD